MCALVSDSFTCSSCGQITRDIDYEWKSRNLYYSLCDAHLCESCARAGKQPRPNFITKEDYEKLKPFLREDVAKALEEHVIKEEPSLNIQSPQQPLYSVSLSDMSLELPQFVALDFSKTPFFERLKQLARLIFTGKAQFRT